MPLEESADEHGHWLPESDRASQHRPADGGQALHDQPEPQTGPPPPPVDGLKQFEEPGPIEVAKRQRHERDGARNPEKHSHGPPCPAGALGSRLGGGGVSRKFWHQSLPWSERGRWGLRTQSGCRASNLFFPRTKPSEGIVRPGQFRKALVFPESYHRIERRASWITARVGSVRTSTGRGS